MSVAALVLGVIATVLAVASLTSQLVAFLLRGARPKLTPIVGRLTPDGLVTTDASCDVQDSLVDASEQSEDAPLIIGVKVVNAGRAPFHVAGWAIRADPGGTSLVPIEKPIGGTEAPHDIVPGGSAIFLTELQHAHRFAESVEGVENPPPQIVLTVWSGKRTYVTKPVSPALLSLGSS